MFLTAPVPHAEAAAAIRGKSTVTRKMFDGLLPEFQQAAFTISGVECFDTLQRVKDAIATLPEGADWEDTKQQIEDELEPWLDNPVARSRRAELLMRMHGFRAYAATNYKLMEAHKEAFPFRQYISTGDDRVRESHAQLNRKVFPSDSKFWDNHTPPWAWGCRCEAVPLTREEAEEMRGEDAAKPPEDQRVLPDFLLKRAEDLGEIHVGNGKVLNVQTDRERTGDPNAFEWRPGEIGMSMEQIKARYDDGTWRQWQGWAEKTKLPTGGSLWTALTGRPDTPPTPAPPAPAPAPKSAAVVRPASADPAAQVGAHLQPSTTRGFANDTARQALDAISSVHSDGGLKDSPLIAKRMARAWGVYVRSFAGGPAGDFTSRVELNPASIHPLNTLTHELGHKIDYEAIGVGHAQPLHPAAFAARADVLAALKATARASDISVLSDVKYRQYLQKDVEWFARGYAQYIATRSGHPGMLAELAKDLADRNARINVWEEADFAPVLPHFDKLFTALGWAVPA